MGRNEHLRYFKHSFRPTLKGRRLLLDPCYHPIRVGQNESSFKSPKFMKSRNVTSKSNDFIGLKSDFGPAKIGLKMSLESKKRFSLSLRNFYLLRICRLELLLSRNPLSKFNLCMLLKALTWVLKLFSTIFADCSETSNFESGFRPNNISHRNISLGD